MRAPSQARNTTASPGIRGTHRLPPSPVLLVPAVINLLLWWTSPNPISFVQGAAAYLLLLLAWWSYWSWQKTASPGLPLVSAIAAAYWLYFGLPLFWGDRKVMSALHPGRQLTDEAVTQAILLVIFGIAVFWLAMKCRLGRRLALKRFPEIVWTPANRVYLQAVAAGGTFIAQYGSLQAIGGEGGRQIILILESTTSLAAVVILWQRVLEGKARNSEKLFLWPIMAARIVLGVSSGVMGTAVILVLAVVLVYLRMRRRLPIAVMAFVAPYLLFFQAGKGEFRRAFWYSQTEASTIEKVEFWVDASLRSWQMAVDDPSGSGIPNLLAFSLSRASLLTQAANVIEQTPSLVPYQYGRLYSYLGVALVPRFFWPDKPSMNDANQFYQVAYGITSERDLQSVSIAVGTLTEGYINFGWLGTALVMFLIGVLLDFWNVTFLTNDTMLAVGIGIALIPQLLSVEFQLAQYLSGVIQHVLLTLVVFLPIVRMKKTATVRPAESEAFEMAGTPS